MPSTDALLGLIDSVHSAGLDPQRWQSVGAEIAAHYSARVAGMFIYRPGDPSWNFSVNVGVDPEWIARFQNDFTIHDNLCEEAFRDMPVGSVAADHMLVPLPQLRQTRLVQEWALPQGLQGAALIKIASDRYSVGILSLIRPRTAGEWEPDDIASLEILSRHLARATEVSRRIGFLEGRLSFAEALADRFAPPVLITDAGARVLHASSAAQTLLARGDALCTERGILGAASHNESVRLRGLIGSAAKKHSQRGGQLALSRRTGRGHLKALVTPAGPEFSGPISLEQRAVVFVSDLSEACSDLSAALRRRFRLTEAEARLVCLFASGDAGTLRAAADQLGVTLNTAKTHLKRVFAKTDTHRQTELVRLALELKRRA